MDTNEDYPSRNQMAELLAHLEQAISANLEGGTFTGRRWTTLRFRGNGRKVPQSLRTSIRETRKLAETVKPPSDKRLARMKQRVEWLCVRLPEEGMKS